MRREKNKYKEYLKLKIRSLKLFFVYRQDHEAENNRLMINNDSSNHIKKYHALTAIIMIVIRVLLATLRIFFF